MTFKHIKFQDSAIMRSLEKQALNNGSIQPDIMVKSASTENEVVDLYPSDNLMLDLVKLCAGLRQARLNKHAEEIESKFVQYKRAQTLYQVSKETGDDLVNAAHPDGSHQLEGVSGDSVIETILDRHQKMLDIVDKKPTGKLANLNAIQSIKIALGAFDIEIEREKFARREMDKIDNYIKKLELLGAQKDWSSFHVANGNRWKFTSNIKEVYKDLSQDMTAESLRDLNTDLRDLNIVSYSVEDQEMIDLVVAAQKCLNAAFGFLRGNSDEVINKAFKTEDQATQHAKSVSSLSVWAAENIVPLQGKLYQLRSKIENSKNPEMTVDNKAQIMGWLDKLAVTLQKYFTDCYSPEKTNFEEIKVGVNKIKVLLGKAEISYNAA